MLKIQQYQTVTGDPRSISWTHNGVFRRGSTLSWRSFTLETGVGTPYVWLVAQCPTSGRLFIQPPRFPSTEIREMVRDAVNQSFQRPGVTFQWPEEEED